MLFRSSKASRSLSAGEADRLLPDVLLVEELPDLLPFSFIESFESFNEFGELLFDSVPWSLELLPVLLRDWFPGSVFWFEFGVPLSPDSPTPEDLFSGLEFGLFWLLALLGELGFVFALPLLVSFPLANLFQSIFSLLGDGFGLVCSLSFSLSASPEGFFSTRSPSIP